MSPRIVWPPFESAASADAYADRPRGPLAVLQFVLEQFGPVLEQLDNRYLLDDTSVLLVVDSWVGIQRLQGQPGMRECGKVPPGVGWEAKRQPIAWMLVGGPVADVGVE